jgi:hypothetical protein
VGRGRSPRLERHPCLGCRFEADSGTIMSERGGPSPPRLGHLGFVSVSPSHPRLQLWPMRCRKWFGEHTQCNQRDRSHKNRRSRHEKGGENHCDIVRPICRLWRPGARLL